MSTLPGSPLFTHLITAEGTPEALLDQAREGGLEVVVAPVPDGSPLEQY